MFAKIAVALILSASVAAAVVTSASSSYPTNQYVISDRRGAARVFDGIGGLSGGGATSVLLWTYPEPQRSEILDFLFKPNFGASLHILKVEIGGDAQSTDGAESSHMHTPWDENYERGYEWWLMLEAKKRNPNIKLYGLAWAYPQWVTCAPNTMTDCTNDIYTHVNVTAKYIVKWIAGAKLNYGLDIDYVGCWNERPYNDTYLKTLRYTLDGEGFTNTKIVAPDGTWDLAEDILRDPVLAEAVWGLGAHYPGTVTTSAAEATLKPLWASEDDSTYNNDVGAGCWARIINQNYVNGNMTASINWNLVAAYMKGTNWYRAGLLSAMQPWEGSYGSLHADGNWTIGPMVWATAHTTQFTEPGSYSYLHQGDGAGHLVNGGSYVTLKNFETGDFTIVVEKMSHEYSQCVRPYLDDFTVSPEVVTIQLEGGLNATTKTKSLHLWFTHWAYHATDDVQTTEFEYQGTVDVVDGRVTLTVTPNSLYTLSTISTAVKGAPPAIPNPPTLFPSYFADDFNNCRISGEGKYFTDQNGIFECVSSNDGTGNIVMKQMVPLRPVTWGQDIRPHSLIGHRDTANMSMHISARLPNDGDSVLLGVRAQGTDKTMGLLFGMNTSGIWGIWTSMELVGLFDFAVVEGQMSPPPLTPGTWHNFSVHINGTILDIQLDGFPVAPQMNLSNCIALNGLTSGHGLIGTMAYGQYTEYDNFELYSSFSTEQVAQVATAGDPVCIAECNSEVGIVSTSQWSFAATPTFLLPGSSSADLAAISLRNQPTLCLTAQDTTDASAPLWLTVETCASPPTANQLWGWTFDGVAPDQERVSYIYCNTTVGMRVLDVYQNFAQIGAQMDAWPFNYGSNQAFFYDYDAAEIANEATSTCLGVCKR